MSPNPPVGHEAPPAARPRRADAERSVERILDAALDALVRDPEASMSDVARGAGVARATIYVHFPTRERLIEAVTDRAIAEVTRAMVAAEPGPQVQSLECLGVRQPNTGRPLMGPANAPPP